MDRFEGILFTLKKRKQYPEIPDKKHYDFVTFGYYDGLSVSYIDRWYQFRPAGIACLCGYVNPGDPFADIYVIKGFFPDKNDRNDDLFDYDFWVEVGRKNPDGSKSKKAAAVLGQCPYICVSSIHLSQVFVEHCGDLDKMTNSINVQIKKAAEESGKNLKEFHCAVFPIIGFSDCIIAFAVDDFEMPIRFINRLREWKVKVNNSNVAAISDCYTICGVHKEFKVTKNNFNADSKARLIAEFNLREGVSAKEFHTILKNEIKSKLEKMEINNDWQKKVDDALKDYYITFGSRDTLVVPKLNIESYLSILLSEEFQPGNRFYEEFISCTKTSICVSENTDTENSDAYYKKKLDNNNNKYEINDDWKKFSRDFEKELKEKKYAVRMLRAIEQIIQNYCNIANTLHGFDVKSILDVFISATLDDIRKCWEDGNIDWKEISDAVGVFRDRVGDFLADLLRSDKPFIEGNTLSHPAIGSATKILFAYTVILNQLAAQMRDNNQEIVFLVISGGADATTAIDLFAFLREDRKPVLIVVPEKGLYDIKGTLFRMLHESMHYCGNRLRVERYDLYLDIMSELMAHDIIEAFWGEVFVEEYLSSAEIYLPPEEYKRILDEAKGEAEKECEKIKKKIKSCIYGYKDFTDYREEHIKESDYYESELFRPYSACGNSEGILSEDHMADIWYRPERPLSGEIAEILSEGEEILYSQINKILRDNNVNIFMTDIRAKLLTHGKKKDKDMRIKTYLDIYGAVLVDNYSVGIYKSESVWYNYDEISKLGFQSMREGRSDLLAIRLLDMRIEEYLLAFIYEEKDIDRAMPETLDNVLRIGSVLKVGFHCSKDTIRKEVLTKIMTYAERMEEEAGYEYEDSKGNMEIYLNKYMERMESLLNVYENKKWGVIAQYVEKYLKDVLKELKEEDNIKQLKEIYRICDMTNRENAYKTIKYLFAQWIYLAGGEANEIAGYTNR